MKNPFLQKSIWTLLYIIWWILPVSIHSFVLWKAFNFSKNIAVIDATISFSILAIISLSLWFMARYTFNNSEHWRKNIVTHLWAMAIVFVIWISTSYGIMILISSEYSSIFEQTILWRILLFIPVYIITIFSYFLFTAIDKNKNQEAEQSKMEAMVRSAEFEALKNQINPHFLFNSLNSASSLTMIDPEKAQEMIINISDFFRFTLISSKQHFTTLESELEHALLYLEIEKVRFGARLSVAANLAPSMKDIKIPSLLLQPLVENAIKHGVYESSKMINIDFSFDDIGDKIKIRISNGIDSDNGIAKKGTSTGLKNVADRLELAYGQNDLIETSKTDDNFEVTLWIPKNDNQDKEEEL